MPFPIVLQITLYFKHDPGCLQVTTLKLPNSSTSIEIQCIARHKQRTMPLKKPQAFPQKVHVSERRLTDAKAAEWSGCCWAVLLAWDVCGVPCVRLRAFIPRIYWSASSNADTSLKASGSMPNLFWRGCELRERLSAPSHCNQQSSPRDQ